MVKIIVKQGRDNSRNRRREERRLRREQDSSDAALERKIDNELNGGRAGLLAEKAVGGLETTDKEDPLESGGADSMHRVVNHAHQRDSKKKWS